MIGRFYRNLITVAAMLPVPWNDFGRGCLPWLAANRSFRQTGIWSRPLVAAGYRETGGEIRPPNLTDRVRRSLVCQSSVRERLEDHEEPP